MKNFMGKALLLLFALLGSPLQSQSVNGRVFDKETKAALANCNISILGDSRGAVTNENGFYSIELPKGKHSLLFQYIGYRSDTIKVYLKKHSVTRDIALQKQILAAEDIVVYADVYSEAEQLILRAAREKKKYLKKLHNYSCKSYVKSAVFRRSNPVNLKYGLLMEFYSRVFWNAPDDYYEIIESQRQSANLPKAINIFSGNTFLNINADRIVLGQKTIVGPTAPDAIKYYHYQIIDTLFQDKERIFKLEIRPKENSAPLMKGVLYLVDKKYVIQKIDVHLNRQCNYGFFRNIHIIQQYSMEQNRLYLPYYSLSAGDWVLDIPKYPKLRYRKESFREDYRINNPANEKYAGQTKIIYENKQPFWAVPMNIPPLTVSEKKGYAQIDSIVKHRPLVSFMTKAVKLLDYYSFIKSQPIGDLSDFYRFNKAEGSFVGFAINSKRLMNFFRFYCAFGRGLSDRKNKYKLKFAYNFRRRSFAVDAAFKQFNTIASREDNTELPVWLNSVNSLVNSFDYFDYYYTKGRTVSFGVNSSPVYLNTALFQEEHTKTKNLIYRGLWGEHSFIPAMRTDEGFYKGLRILFNYSTAGYRQTALSTELLLSRSYTEISYFYETAVQRWGSSAGFKRQQLHVYVHQSMFYNAFLDLQFTIAGASAHLPLQRYFELESGFSGYDRFKTFRTLRLNAFTGLRKITLFGEYNFHNTLFRWSRLPYIRTMPLDLVLIFNRGWAGNDRWAHLRWNRFYSEAGFGLGRLFSILKLEFLWGLGGRHGGKNFVFSVKMSEIEL